MKKLLTFLMVAVATVSCAFAFSACELFGDGESSGGNTENNVTDDTQNGGNNSGNNNSGNNNSGGNDSNGSNGSGNGSGNNNSGSNGSGNGSGNNNSGSNGSGNGSDNNNSGSNGSGNGSDNNNSGSNGSGNNNSESHTHKYTWQITAPTQSEKGSAAGKCSCGDEKTLTLPVLSDGKYNKTNDTATCTSKGKIDYTITLDGETVYFSTQTNLKPHDYVDGKCSVCGAAEAPHAHTLVGKTNDEGHWVECECGFKTSVQPHSFSYVIEGDYHWQVCAVNAEVTEKQLHTFVGDFCECGLEKEHDPDEIKTAVILHEQGSGKYLWDVRDIAQGRFDFYGAKWQITTYGGDVSYEAVKCEHIKSDVGLTVGEQILTMQYGGKTAAYAVFITDENGIIEAVENQAELLNSDGNTEAIDINSTSSCVGNLIIKGLFKVGAPTKSADEYYGSTYVDRRFLGDFDETSAGMQNCKITAGNISASPAVFKEISLLAYTSSEIENKIIVSEILIKTQEGTVVETISLSAERPFIDVQDYPDRFDYGSLGYVADFVFKKSVNETYSGGSDQLKNTSTEEFDLSGGTYEILGDTDIRSVFVNGERSIRIKDANRDYEAFYAVYDSDYTKIRVCRVDGQGVFQYELGGDVTVESVKADLLTRNLYVEYFEEVDGKYEHFVPITEDMLEGFDSVDGTSFDWQRCTIKYEDKAVSVMFAKPYSVAGATVRYTLTGSENLILSEATVDDLGKCLDDKCTEIVLYNNGVAVLKGIKNFGGDVMTGYTLVGNDLTLNQRGSVSTLLTVNAEKTTFKARSLETLTAGQTPKEYVYNHQYDLGGNLPIGWTATLTVYNIDYSVWYGYVKVHLTGWASSVNDDGYAYQIAGVDYLATYAIGMNNNKNSFVLRFADKDWWFDVHTVDSDGNYLLTLTDLTENTVR